MIGRRCARCWRRTMPARCASSWWMTAARDGTGAIARGLREPQAAPDVLTGAPRPAGWSGKLWAVAQGLAEAGDADLLLLTDADIVHDPRPSADAGGPGRADAASTWCRRWWRWPAQPGGARAGAGVRVLLPVALSVRLGERSAARHRRGGRRHDPDPPPRARPDRRHRGGARRTDRRRGAGGGGQARRPHLARPLGALARSVRPYPGVADIWRMVARTAYVQLRFSPLLLLGTTLGMALTFLVPPVAALFGHGMARWFGLVAWGMMAACYLPTLHRYRRSPSVGARPASGRGVLPGRDASVRRSTTISAAAWPGKAAPIRGRRMSGAANVETWSGKDRGDENFPVGSLLIRRDLRAARARVLRLRPQRRRHRRFRHPAAGRQDRAARRDGGRAARPARRRLAERAALRASLAETGVTPRHATDLLIAFRRDATKLRYATWDELYDYCRYSAMPVGRHVLDLHGEQHATPTRRPTRCARRCRC